MTRRILITGGAGSIGRKLRAHLGAQGGYELVALDRATRGDAEVQAADLSVWDDGWVGAFEGVDTVFHLAGDPSPRASWASIQQLNLDLMLNVFEAAALHKCRRLVFASSNWTLAGYRFDDVPLTPAMEPYPVNAYGVSKLVGERVGRSFADRRGLSVICFRIGYCQHIEGNPPGPTMAMGSWGQEMWLSDGDICQAFEKAVLAPDTLRFAVLNLMSANQGMRWDLEPTREAIGYVPKDRSVPVISEEMRANEATAEKAHRMIEATRSFIAESRW